MPDKNEDSLEFVGVKMRKGLVEVMDEYIKKDTHTNRSEFLRTAIREKIQQDMPGLWDKFLNEHKLSEDDIEVEVTQ